tara:strand:- start:478 stop:675 length:198 start_codon:yes stop_codon:yes gene_type:complete
MSKGEYYSTLGRYIAMGRSNLGDGACHLDYIRKTYGSTYYNKITILYIPDHYAYYAPGLLKLFEK